MIFEAEPSLHRQTVFAENGLHMEPTLPDPVREKEGGCHPQRTCSNACAPVTPRR